MPSYRARPKVNMYLHVTGRRSDGYHLLDSYVVFPDSIADIVTVEPATLFSFDATGPFAKNLPEDHSGNLMVKAADLFCSFTGFDKNGFSLNLEKNLPLGAGLGGGSSDAAQIIRALQDFSGISLDDEVLLKILVQLGADVPVCYRSSPARFQGIGDIVTPAPPPPPMAMLLLWPGAHSDTRNVFLERKAPYTENIVAMPDTFPTYAEWIAFLKKTQNDLSAAAQTLNPVIAEAERFMTVQQGCLLARMSGSGASVFGLFEDMQSCRQAAGNARMKQDWWAAETFF
jgi:4-diphosphocytidyl-2-C-methyl-D-erythritol kinase